MTILVTGATGLVGRHVTEELVARGADVRAFVRNPRVGARIGPCYVAKHALASQPPL
jgi:uncharacterized protein YbjT (DUF2867 family)